jgi:MFS family permease
MGDRVAPRHGRPRSGPAAPSHGPRGPPGQLAEASADAGTARPAGRAFVGWVSDYFGRRQTLLAVCVILALSSFGVGWTGSIQNQALFITFAVISGFGGGAFYPLFAALTPDYFGENYNASNYGTVYSAKLAGAVAAGPIAAALIDANGYPATYLLAGSFSLLAAVLILFLRQPTAVPAMRPALAGEASKT